MVLHFDILVGLAIHHGRGLLRWGREELGGRGKCLAAVCDFLGLLTGSVWALCKFAVALGLLVCNLPHLLSQFVDEVGVIALWKRSVRVGIGAAVALARGRDWLLGVGWWRALLVEAKELFLDAAVAECGQDGRDGPVGVLELAVQPLVSSLMALLLDNVLVQLLQ